MKTSWISLLFITLLTMSLLVSGCGKVAEQASEKAAEKAIEKASGGKAKVDLDKDGNVEIKTSDGTIKTGSNEWPGQIPTDVPRFTEGEITTVVESTDKDQGKGVFVGIVNAGIDSADKYKNELEKAGWNIAMSSQTPETVMLVAQKDNRVVTVNFAISEGKLASGGITYAEEK
jgi:uncharacterized protein YceK